MFDRQNVACIENVNLIELTKSWTMILQNWTHELYIEWYLEKLKNMGQSSTYYIFSH